MKLLKRCLYITVLSLLAGCATTPRDTAHQHSTIDALLAGVYDGSLTLAELSTHGNFGIGTFDRLDGEMLMMDKHIYQIKSDGKVYTPPLTLTTPFATVCRFNPEQEFDIKPGTDFEALKEQIAKVSGNPNLFYAIRIEGRFKTMHTRSVPAQSKPYPDLKTVAENQPEFHMQDVEGVIVGFKCPAYVEGINVPGCHLHFLSSDKAKGGHILDFEVISGRCEIDTLTRYTLTLPTDSDFAGTDLSLDRSHELKSVEQ
jgi:acetolactate decarboxylase